MKYMTLIYERQGGLETLTGEQHDALVQQHVELAAETRDSGLYLGSVELKPPPTARSLRSESGQVMISDGPFAESKEYFIGYYLFDCESLSQAQQLAGGIPTGPGGGIEVRPVDEGRECGVDLPARDAASLAGREVFAVLNYHPETWAESYSEAEMAQLIRSNVELSEQALARGDYLGGYKLMSTATATALRGENARRQITDGPFCEAKEVLLGFHLLCCRDIEQAVDYAAGLDVAAIGVVEVRPVNYYGPADPAASWSAAEACNNPN